MRIMLSSSLVRALQFTCRVGLNREIILNYLSAVAIILRTEVVVQTMKTLAARALAKKPYLGGLHFH